MKELINKIKATLHSSSMKKEVEKNVNLYNHLKNSSLLKSQLRNPQSVPIMIINYNQLYYLEKLINFLLKRNFENIVIIDNQSDFPPLLDYYQSIEDKVTIEKMPENVGHKVFFKTPWLQEKYGKGYFVLTDADILPNDNLPENFLGEMIKLLDQYFSQITKVGFALDLETIPDTFPLKEKVLKHEAKFWEEKISENLYFANLDTTFAVYKPLYPSKFTNIHRLRSIRVAGNFTAKHGGWYIDPENYSEENLHYIKTVDKSSSWKLNEEGKHDNKGKKKYN